jgi:hypothetical protein
MPGRELVLGKRVKYLIVKMTNIVAYGDGLLVLNKTRRAPERYREIVTRGDTAQREGRLVAYDHTALTG